MDKFLNRKRKIDDYNENNGEKNKEKKQLISPSNLAYNLLVQAVSTMIIIYILVSLIVD